MFYGPVELIKKSEKILLLTHKDPDGDALGSLLGLSFALLKLDKKICPVLSEEISQNLLFLPGLKMLQGKTKPNPDLIILLDFPDLKRSELSKETERLIRNTPSILIDHHPKGDLCNLCTYQIYNQKAAATAELLYFLINKLSVTIDKNIATALLTGIITDTNSFQNSNTTIESFEIASSLLSAGARVEPIINSIFYQKSPNILKLWGRAMMRLWKNEKYNLLITVLTSDDFRKCGIGKEGTEGVINFLSLTLNPSVNGVLLLAEENGKIKGSLRTQKERVDFSTLARILGGGGHQKASGFIIDGKLKYSEGCWQII